MTQDQIQKFNSLYNQACTKMDGLIILEGYRPRNIGFFEKKRAKKAIAYFHEAISIYPAHWQTHFFLGKLYQRLRNYTESLFHFERALNLEDSNHTIPQEASLIAMHLNDIEKAIEYSRESLKRKPDSFALLGNHSMNLLIAGQDEEARDTINKAILINPNDEINKRIKEKIEAVIAGQTRRPTFQDSLI